ncbi:DUF1413 domain-containing protein [Lacrimispora xylanisolvens]
MDVNELLELAIKETDNVLDGEVFLVKDLFKGYEWNRIVVKDRLLWSLYWYRQARTSKAPSK